MQLLGCRRPSGGNSKLGNPANPRSLLKWFTSLLLVLGFAGLAAAQVEDQDEPQWWRGNLHTHSLWSDGDDFPEMITKWYVDNGYHFLAITDHNILSQGERWMGLPAVEKRAGKTVLEKYRAEFGELVEIRKKESGGKTVEQVRLRTLEEFRGPFEASGKFLLIEAEEISDKVGKRPLHMNATNLRSVIQPASGKTMVEAINNNLRAVEEQAAKNGQPILVHLNHPNFGWAVTAEELAMATREKFFEVYNGHPSINHLGDARRPGVEKMWDICNTIRIAELKSAPMFGLATDDSHQYHGRQGKKNARTGRGWVVVRAKSLTAISLIAAMRAGDFYSSSGVELDSVDFDKANGKLSLRIKPVQGQTFKTEFIGTMADYDKSSSVRLGADGKPMRATKVYSSDVGKVLGSSDTLTPKYQLTGKELYVRAVVTSSQDHGNPSFENQKQQAWTQPVVGERH